MKSVIAAAGIILLASSTAMAQYGYYGAPVVAAPVPTVSYYAPAPTVSYYAPPPTVSYYAPAPTVAYYPGAPVYGYPGPVVVAPRVVIGGPGVFGPRVYVVGQPVRNVVRWAVP
jgi:hypothetical protein